MKRDVLARLGRLFRRPSTLSMMFACAMLAGCGDDGGGDADAAVADAGPPDATPRCPAGELFLTGDYVDWDSTDENFLGVFMATFTDLDAPDATATTAPNGRIELCVPDADIRDLSVTQPDYLSARYRVSRDAARAGPFQHKGLTAARADSLFADELGLGRNGAAAQVIVAVRNYPGATPVIGAQVAIDTPSDGAFTAGPDGTYAAGDTTTDDAFVLFANAIASGPETAVTVTPPAGTTCAGSPTVTLQVGEINMVSYACSTQ